MSVPSNLIPTRVTQLPEDFDPSTQGWLMYVREGVNYKVQASKLIAVSGVPADRQVLAGTALTGGGMLSDDVTLGIAPGGVTATELSSTGVTAATYGSASQVAQITVDATGRITSASNVAAAVDASVATGILPMLHGGTGSTTAADARTALGLGTLATQASDAVSVTGGSISGITDLAVVDGGTGASNSTAARASLACAVLGVNDDITSLTALTGPVKTATYVDIAPGIAKPAHAEGRVFYDYVEKSLAYYNEASDLTVNVGQEELIRVYNATLSSFTDGQVIYISGADGGFPTIALARSDASATSKSTLGLVTHVIAPSTYGYVTTSGVVHDLNTNVDSEGHTLATGDTLYLSATIAGGYTNIPPVQPNYDITVGYVTFKSATVGNIYVHIDKQPWYGSLQLLNSASSVVLPTAPAVFILPTAPANQGFTYSAVTGVTTFNTSGTYTFTLALNATPSASNKKVYFYLETNVGAGWVINRYSARVNELTTGLVTQIVIADSGYFSAGTQLRFNVWADATVTLNSTDLPGTTAGTVTLPAARVTWA